MTNSEDGITTSNSGQWLVPMTLKHWVKESLRANQELLKCLRRYPNARGVNQDIVPIIQLQLTELSSTNLAINELTDGWINKEVIEEVEI